MLRAPRSGLLLLALLLPLAQPATARRLLAPTPQAADPLDGDYYVRVEDGGFVLGCNKFYVSGWNQWEVVDAAAGGPKLSGATIPTNSTGPELIRTMMDAGVAAGFNTMRFWGYSINPQYTLQTKPGVYNEEVFQGLDYVLDEARQRGLKLILAFGSNWTPVGGIPQYLKWAGTTDQVQFYTNPTIIKWYQDWIATVLRRVNSISGRTYSDDPTIMAFDLLNEPRCVGCPKGTVANWYAVMARHVKSLDRNHLVTTGEEGFYGCCGNAANPGAGTSDWAGNEGQDFLADHASSDIDFAVIHAWVDNWNDVSLSFISRWIAQHTSDAATVLRKPLLMEEYGKMINATAGATLDSRNTFFRATYTQMNGLMAQPTALKGAMFWQWYDGRQVAGSAEGGGRGFYGVYQADDAFQSIRDNAAAAKQLSTPLPGCVLATHRAAESDAPDCSRTWVDGVPGTGMEGKDCNEPINECVRGTAVCDDNAACVDTAAGYTCECFWGFRGDGKTCSPDASALAQLTAAYFSQPDGGACTAGLDVEYPSDAPGYVYDPLSSFSFYNSSSGGKYGARENVTLLECQIACQVAEACESIGYNDALQSCFLKRGQCPAYNTCRPPLVLCNSTLENGQNYSMPCGYWITYYRLDMDTSAACAQPPPWGQAQTDNLARFQQFRAANAARANPAAEKAAPAAAAPQAERGAPGGSQVPLLGDAGSISAGSISADFAGLAAPPGAERPEGQIAAVFPLSITADYSNLGTNGGSVQLLEGPPAAARGPPAAGK